ncbi:hypothetical protein, partial [Klebsiella pneumoniae]|uniref:hypothetical protein n=1 Tax=Klebsiella pneumoniae TaxID=573 RepID=UPI002730DBDE
LESLISAKTGQQIGCTPAVIIGACDNTLRCGFQLPVTSAFQLGTMDAVFQAPDIEPHPPTTGPATALVASAG